MIARRIEAPANEKWRFYYNTLHNPPRAVLVTIYTAMHQAMQSAQQAPDDVERSIDSGMDGDSVALAEQLWASLPTGNRTWAGLATHEKALVCHTLARFRAAIPQHDNEMERLREALGRIASNGFGYPLRDLSPTRDKEMLSMMDYARTALATEREG